jgi:hypothetical protein
MSYKQDVSNICVLDPRHVINGQYKFYAKTLIAVLQNPKEWQIIARTLI